MKEGQFCDEKDLVCTDFSYLNLFFHRGTFEFHMKEKLSGTFCRLNSFIDFFHFIRSERLFLYAILIKISWHHI